MFSLLLYVYINNKLTELIPLAFVVEPVQNKSNSPVLRQLGSLSIPLVNSLILSVKKAVSKEQQQRAPAAGMFFYASSSI